MSELKYRNNYGDGENVRVNWDGTGLEHKKVRNIEEEAELEAQALWCEHMDEIEYELKQLELMDVEEDEVDIEMYYSHKREIEKARARSNR